MTHNKPQTPRISGAHAESVVTADAHLKNVGLPTYSEGMLMLSRLVQAVKACTMSDWVRGHVMDAEALVVRYAGASLGLDQPLDAKALALIDDLCAPEGSLEDPGLLSNLPHDA